MGPKGGTEEEVEGRSVYLNYITGKLFPQNTEGSDLNMDEYLNERETDSSRSTENESDYAPEADDAASQSFQELQSSMGLSFCVPGDEESISVEIKAGIYLKVKGKKKLKRKPLEETIDVDLSNLGNGNLITATEMTLGECVYFDVTSDDTALYCLSGMNYILISLKKCFNMVF